MPHQADSCDASRVHAVAVLLPIRYYVTAGAAGCEWTQPRGSAGQKGTPMATRNWFGGKGSVSNPNNWSPQGTPQPGDTLVATQGKLIDFGAAGAGARFELDGTSSTPTLYLIGASVGSVNMPESHTSANVVVFGHSQITGGIFADEGAFEGTPRTLNVNIAPFSQLTLGVAGAASASSSLVFANTDVTIQGGYHSSFSLPRPSGIGIGPESRLEVDTSVVGGGLFSTTVSGTFVFGSSVSADTVVSLDGGNLEIEHPKEFLGQIDGLGSDFFPGSGVLLDGIKDVLSGTLTDAALDLLGSSGRTLAELTINQTLGHPAPSAVYVVQQSSGVFVTANDPAYEQSHPGGIVIAQS